MKTRTRKVVCSLIAIMLSKSSAAEIPMIQSCGDSASFATERFPIIENLIAVCFFNLQSDSVNHQNIQYLHITYALYQPLIAFIFASTL